MLTHWVERMATADPDRSLVMDPQQLAAAPAAEEPRPRRLGDQGRHFMSAPPLAPRTPSRRIGTPACADVGSIEQATA
jgi:hypothetical protein